nr:hypothetical protein [uncultured Cohaesibacter sp.]
MRPQQLRRLITKYSAFVVVLVPTILSCLYFGLVASNQYAVEVRFAVRGFNSSATHDLLGLVTGGASSGSTTSDSYILMDYLHSREFVEQLGTKVDLAEIYGRNKADYFSAFNPDLPIEELVEYWKNKATLSYDTASQIIVAEIKAFTPEDAEKVATELLTFSEALVNELSAKARADAVSHAQREVAKIETRLRQSRKTIRTFREKEQVIDPSKEVESRLSLISRLEGEIMMEKARLSSQAQFLNKDAPRVKVITSKIEAMEKQLAAEKQQMSAAGTTNLEETQALTGQLLDYRDILMDQEFLEKAYLSALSSLETARLDANSRQRYLAVFVRPSLPESALYPKRISSILVTLVISIFVWAIGTLIVYAVRDHMT